MTGVAVYLLAWKRGVHGYRLVLVGIGVAAMLTAVNSYLLTKADLVDAARADALADRHPQRPRLGAGLAAARRLRACCVPLVLALRAGRCGCWSWATTPRTPSGVRVERTRLRADGARPSCSSPSRPPPPGRSPSSR